MTSNILLENFIKLIQILVLSKTEEEYSVIKVKIEDTNIVSI
jgi:hypothetical protein